MIRNNNDKHKQLCNKRNIWKYDNGNCDLLKQYVTIVDWLCLKSNNININAENVTSKSLEFRKLTIPNKMITLRPLYPPWINNEIRKIIRKRKRAHKHAKKVNTPNNWEKFQKLRNKSISAFRVAQMNIKSEFQKEIHQGNFQAKIGGKLLK